MILIFSNLVDVWMYCKDTICLSSIYAGFVSVWTLSHSSLVSHMKIEHSLMTSVLWLQYYHFSLICDFLGTSSFRAKVIMVVFLIYFLKRLENFLVSQNTDKNNLRKESFSLAHSLRAQHIPVQEGDSRSMRSSLVTSHPQSGSKEMEAGVLHFSSFI